MRNFAQLLPKLQQLSYLNFPPDFLHSIIAHSNLQNDNLIQEISKLPDILFSNRDKYGRTPFQTYLAQPKKHLALGLKVFRAKISDDDFAIPLIQSDNLTTCRSIQNENGYSNTFLSRNVKNQSQVHGAYSTKTLFWAK